MSLFSTPGKPPTQLELELFAKEPNPPRDLWAEIGQLHGLAVLLSVLDVLGGTKLEMPPTRHSYIQRMWRPVRDEQMRAMRAKGHSVDAIAKRFEVSEPTVYRVFGLGNAQTTEATR